MSEENKALLRRWVEEFDKKNFAIVKEDGHTQRHLPLSGKRTLES